MSGMLSNFTRYTKKQENMIHNQHKLKQHKQTQKCHRYQNQQARTLKNYYNCISYHQKCRENNEHVKQRQGSFQNDPNQTSRNESQISALTMILHGNNDRLDISEENVSKLGDIATETTQGKTEREK